MVRGRWFVDEQRGKFIDDVVEKISKQYGQGDRSKIYRCINSRLSLNPDYSLRIMRQDESLKNEIIASILIEDIEKIR